MHASASELCIVSVDEDKPSMWQPDLNETKGADLRNLGPVTSMTPRTNFDSKCRGYARKINGFEQLD